MSAIAEWTMHEYSVTWTIPRSFMAWVTPEWVERREARRKAALCEWLDKTIFAEPEDGN